MAEKGIYIAECVGGPMNRQMGQSRYPKGFLVVSNVDSAVCVYDYEVDKFLARPPAVLDEQRLEKAASEPNYDVRAYDPETMRGI